MRSSDQGSDIEYDKATQPCGHPMSSIVQGGDEDRLNFHTMTRSSVLDVGCENDCAIELDCDHGACDSPALFVIQHQLSSGDPMGDDFSLVTIARCRSHSTVTRGMTDA